VVGGGIKQSFLVCTKEAFNNLGMHLFQLVPHGDDHCQTYILGYDSSKSLFDEILDPRISDKGCVDLAGTDGVGEVCKPMFMISTSDPGFSPTFSSIARDAR
jgi:hypothetical protein